MQKTTVQKKIEKRGSKYVVLSKKGKVLGTHDTKKEAQAQLGAVEASKARKRKAYFGSDLND